MLKFTLLSLAGGITFAFLIVTRLVRAVFGPSRDLPGPLFARFTTLWYLGRTFHDDFRWQNIDLHIKYGKVVRLAPNQYSVDDSSAAKQIYGTSTNFAKSDWYDYWKNPDPHSFQDIFSIRDPRKHAHNRKVIASLYSMTNLIQMEGCVDESIRLLILKFDKFAKDVNSFDLLHWMRCYAFDAVFYITVNKRFGILDTGNDDGMFKKISTHETFSARAGLFPSVWTKLVNVLMMLKVPTPIDPIIAFVNDQIQEFEKSGEADKMEKSDVEQQSMFHRAFAAHYADPDRFPHQALNTVGIMNVVAGSDTTSAGLAAAIHFLSVIPETLQKLRSEIEATCVEGNLSSAEAIPFHTLQKLPYLQAVLKEAMRLHSPVGMPMPRTVPAGGAVLAGTYFPAGTSVGINPWVAHRNKSVFGDDAEEFKPDRWLSSDLDRINTMEGYLLTFGLGSRSCIGKSISLLEMSKVLPVLVMRYEFEFLDERVRKDPMRGVKSDGGWFVLQTNLLVKLKRR